MSASLPNNEKLTPLEPTGADPLTGMLIRQFFVAELIEQAVHANSTGQTFSLCLIDSDQQKNINLDYGQQIGDEVLAQVSRRLRLVLADCPATVFGRYDGNCFGLLLPGTNLGDAGDIAEACRRDVGSTDIQQGVRVTVSAGVAQYRLWESAEGALSRAEQALHLAKQFGRDRVEVANSPASLPEIADVIPLTRSV